MCAVNDRDGCHYAYSLGGYHADEDERTVIQADTHGGPFFRSTPIDIHCLDFGVCVCCPEVCGVLIVRCPDSEVS